MNNILRNPGILLPLLYIFVATIPHAIAPRYILAGAMLIALLYQLVRGQLLKPPLNLVSISIFGLCAWTLLSAAVSPYYAESLPLLKKETLPFLVAFILLICQPLNDIQSKQLTRYVFAALILGFSVKLFLALGDGIQNDWRFSVYDYPTPIKPRYLDFFASDTHYYLPFLLAPMLFWPMKIYQRAFLFVVIVLTLLLSLTSGVRTSFITISMILLVFLIFRFWPYKKIILGTLAVIVLAAFLAKDYVTNPRILRYYGIFSMQTYSFGNDFSVSERGAIAKAVWEINQDRLLLGYGPDWKKLPIVAENGGYLERWKTGVEPWHQWALNYFTLNKFGQINPHNFYLMVMFEVGAIGLAIYLLAMLAIAYRGGRLCFNARCDMADRGVGLALFAYIGVYLGAGISGGPWLPMTLLVAACVVMLMLKQSKGQR